MPYVSYEQQQAVWASRKERGETPTRMKATPITQKPKKPKSWLNRAGHFALDIAGLVPLYGNIADGINAAWYAGEGDYANAALSSAAAIPGAGYAAFGAKMGLKGIKTAYKPTTLVGKGVVNPLKKPGKTVGDNLKFFRSEEDTPFYSPTDTSMGSTRIPQGSSGWKKANTTAKGMGLSLKELVNRRNSAEKGSAEYAAAQNAINAAYGVKKRY